MSNQQGVGRTRDQRVYRGPGFLSMFWLTHTPSPPFPSASFSLLSDFLCVELADDDERGGGAGEGAKSYDEEKAWSSFNNLTLSGGGVCWE